MIHNISKYSFICLILLLISLSANGRSQSTMFCEISSIGGQEVTVSEKKYDNDLKYDFQLIDIHKIITVTLGVIRPEHDSILFKNSAEEASKVEVVEDSHKTYEKMWEEELFHTVTLLHSKNHLWEQRAAKLSIWKATFNEHDNLIGFWSAASNDEMFTLSLNALNLSNQQELVPTNVIANTVNEVLSQCRIKSLKNDPPLM
ncbi:hypothetical protein [Pseudoalteromonas sp. S558]|uniref:hypothetical protein n=1 Tax=Pseudoalteromonas sp. S558 TaxID=2066515 RepID=UPI00127F2616|nr:hypothetical protein [Pseudoalteromonas sp. S558]TMN95625.1 hypothetical protein CWB66_18255 [Pseudoalteromonas sp. S558]